MTLINFQKRKELIHDGLEDDFLRNEKEISCPCCDAVVRFGLYNSKSFDKLEDCKKTKMVSKMRGVKLSDGLIPGYRYKESPLRISEKKCSKGIHDIFAIFTYKEIQPARYESYLIGVFNSNDV